MGHEPSGKRPASFTGVPSFSFDGGVEYREPDRSFTQCSPFFPESTISADANLLRIGISGVVTYKGNMYPMGARTAPAALSLEFSAGTVTVPALTRFPTVVTVPFMVDRGVFLTDAQPVPIP